MSGSDYIATPGYEETYVEQASLPWIGLALLSRGIAMPGVSTACELGFGQGLSLAIHAAASSTAWYGVDLNPEHVRAARELVDAAGVRTDLSCETIEAFAARRDLPDFDLVVMNGVWSWVSSRTREAILRFVAARLRPGGIFLVDYVVLPGWAPFLPLRELLVEVARSTGGEEASPLPGVDRALAFSQRLLEASSAYLEAFPKLRETLAGLPDRERRVLAHDLFNIHHRPMTFIEVAGDMERAGLDFAGRAELDRLESTFLTPRQRGASTGFGGRRGACRSGSDRRRCGRSASSGWRSTPRCLPPCAPSWRCTRRDWAS